MSAEDGFRLLVQVIIPDRMSLVTPPNSNGRTIPLTSNVLFINVFFSCFFTAGELSEFSVPLELSQYSVKADPARKPLLVSLLIAKLNLKSVLGNFLLSEL